MADKKREGGGEGGEGLDIWESILSEPNAVDKLAIGTAMPVIAALGGRALGKRMFAASKVKPKAGVINRLTATAAGASAPGAFIAAGAGQKKKHRK